MSDLQVIERLIAIELPENRVINIEFHFEWSGVVVTPNPPRPPRHPLFTLLSNQDLLFGPGAVIRLEAFEGLR